MVKAVNLSLRNCGAARRERGGAGAEADAVKRQAKKRDKRDRDESEKGRQGSVESGVNVGGGGQQRGQPDN